MDNEPDNTYNAPRPFSPVGALQAELMSMGWGFYQTGPNEGEWLKFDETGDKVTARSGDATWRDDYATAKRKLGRGLLSVKLDGIRRRSGAGFYKGTSGSTGHDVRWGEVEQAFTDVRFLLGQVDALLRENQELRDMAKRDVVVQGGEIKIDDFKPSAFKR